jgi:hypothetical protein
MKRIPFIKFSLCVLIAISSYAQTNKTFKESFDVNKDVEVFLNVDNAEIIIETWSKNRVEVEATFSIDIEDKDLANEILEKAFFEALGNSSKVEIKSSQMNRFDLANTLRGNRDFRILTEDVRGLPIATPPMPPLPEMDFDFDMDRFNEEGRAYVIRFQNEVKDIVNDSTFKKEMKEWKYKVEKDMKGLKDSVKVFTYELKNDLQPKVIRLRENLREMQSPHRKVKKKIIIKMPKDAKLNLDVKRSELKIASLYQIDANLNYSGLHIEELTGSNSSVAAVYSGVDILKANGLNLDLKYAKNVNIGEVSELISTSKTSNLIINMIKERAIIEGSFGDLVIKEVSKDFKLIDINLKNSSAKLNLPDVSYNFYINSKSSDFNLDNVLDYKVNTAFDSKIYQNKNSVNSSKVLNIKADYSSFELY